MSFDNLRYYASDSFLRSTKWRHLRAFVLRRDDYLCQRCKRYGRRVEATEVHHIKPRDEYPELALTASNCVSLCRACHRAAHPEKGGRH